MTNPFKPEDKILTKVKGMEVEATVRQVWNEEVQVRIPGGALLWRTIRTVRLPSSEPPGTTEETAMNTPGSVVASVAGPEESIPAPVIATTGSEPEQKPVEAIASSVPEVGEAAPASLPHQNSPAAKQKLSSCGVRDDEAGRKRQRKARRRR